MSQGELRSEADIAHLASLLDYTDGAVRRHLGDQVAIERFVSIVLGFTYYSQRIAIGLNIGDWVVDNTYVGTTDINRRP